MNVWGTILIVLAILATLAFIFVRPRKNGKRTK